VATHYADVLDLGINFFDTAQAYGFGASATMLGDRNLDIVDELERFAEQREFPVGQLAIAWTLANPAVDVAIVGARNPGQIEQTAPAADIHLGTADLNEIERIMKNAVPVGGPAPELM
jgi:aryl-alcohol dehydrogenase-like predicted oxidoreductase